MNISRRSVFQGTAAVAGLVIASRAVAATGEIELLALPQHVYKTADFNHERTESWVFYLFVQSGEAVALKPKTLRVDLFSGARLAKSTTYVEEGFAALTLPTLPLKATLPDGSAPPKPTYWPFAIRIRNTEPAAAAIDSMQIAVEAAGPGGQVLRAGLKLPVETYKQRTTLIYPFRGKGIILQAGVTNGGHKNRSGQFALDGFGLTDTYAVMAKPGPGTAPSEYAGWGREIVAPAAGRIVHARGDRPDQPDANSSDPKYFAPEFPNGGDPGNHLIIDHENGEFSMLAHFQAGSLAVKTGDRVRQGDRLGKLGASGDASGPHVHYQLQSGPDWQFADGLPCSFSNVSESSLVRGTYFEAT
jgi:hypothetical protein